MWHRRRLLIPTSSYPRDESDGTAHFVAALSEACAAAGAQCRVVTPARKGIRPGIAWERGVEVVRFATPAARGRLSLVDDAGLPARFRRGPLSFAALTPAYLSAFATALRQARFRPHADVDDAVVAHWLVPAGWLAAYLPGLPARRIAVAHSSDVAWLERMPGGAAQARALAARVRIGATSVALAERLAHLGVASADLRLGVALPDPVHVTSRGAAEPPRLCTLSRLVRGKGLHRALEVAARSPGRRLTILGDGPLRPELIRQAHELGVELHAPGMVRGATKAAALGAHDVLLFLPASDGGFGREDNLPIAVVEALGAGMGVVASEIPALRAWLADCRAVRLLDGREGGPDVDVAAAAAAALGRIPTAERVAAAHAAAQPFAMPAALDRLDAALRA